MKKNIIVNLDFINKKGELKHVKFWMDKQSYEMTSFLSEEERYDYLVEEYRDFCREQNYKKRNITFSKIESKIHSNLNCNTDDAKELFFVTDDYDLYESELANMAIEKLEKYLTEEEMKIYICYYHLNKSKVEIAEEMNVSEGTIRYRLNKIIHKFRNLI